MAPQSSAISPSSRSRFHRNRLALIDPSSIRRSPRLTPVTSTVGSESGGILRADSSGGRVKRLSVESRLIAENLERIGGGGGRVKRMSTEERLIAENLVRNDGGGIGKEFSGGGRVKRLSTEQRLIAENLEGIGGGRIGKELSGGELKNGKKRSWTCTSLIDPNLIRRSTRLRVNEGDNVDAFKKIEYMSLGDGSSNRRQRKSAGGGSGVTSMRVEQALQIFGSDSAEFSLEEESRKKKMRTEPSAASLAKEKGKKGHIASFLIGDLVPEEEAKRRWPWRFEKV